MRALVKKNLKSKNVNNIFLKNTGLIFLFFSLLNLVCCTSQSRDDKINFLKSEVDKKTVKYRNDTLKEGIYTIVKPILHRSIFNHLISKDIERSIDEIVCENKSGQVSLNYKVSKISNSLLSIVKETSVEDCYFSSFLFFRETLNVLYFDKELFELSLSAGFLKSDLLIRKLIKQTEDQDCIAELKSNGLVNNFTFSKNGKLLLIDPINSKVCTSILSIDNFTEDMLDFERISR